MNTPTNIQYDSDQTSAITALYNKNKHDGGGSRSGISRFLVRKGIVKDEKGATKLVIGVAVVIFLIAAYLLYVESKPATVNPIGRHITPIGDLKPL